MCVTKFVKIKKTIIFVKTKKTMDNSNSGMAQYMGAIGSSVINSSGRKKAQQRQFKQQEKMANKANAYNLDMWNKTNMYNSPIEQRKRLEEAGLNPALMYGGSGNSGQSGSLPKAETFNPPFSEPTNVNLDKSISSLAQFQDIKLRQARIDNVRADTSVKDSLALSAFYNKDAAYFDSQEKRNTYYTRWQTKKEGVSDRKGSVADTLARSQASAAEEKLRQIRMDNQLRQKDLKFYEATKFTNNSTANTIMQGVMRMLNRRK